jgi:DHA2 family multidrug resistance protein-like MFS transporter
MLTPALARRVRPTRLITWGLCVSAVGFALLTLVGGHHALAVLVTAFVIYSLGLAPVFTLATDVIIGSAPPERAGAAASISETGSEFGGALGIALLGSIGTALYRGKLGPDAPPGVPGEAWEIARETLGAALSVAERFPGEAGRQIVGLTRDAFASTLHLSGAVAAIMVLATAWVAWLILARANSDLPSS